MLDNANYKIMFMLDSLAMITVHHPKYGVIEVFTIIQMLYSTTHI